MSIPTLTGTTLFGYLLGCLGTGYYLVRYVTGSDVRDHGSGGTGATNAARVLGRSGFIGVFVLDCMKGVIAVLVAKFVGAGSIGMALASIAAVLGHLFPIQLQFRGGKGGSTALGALLVLVPLVAITSLIVSAVFAAFTRKTTLSGVATFLLMPFFGLAIGYSGWEMAGLVGVTILLLIGHRTHLRALSALIMRRVPPVGGSAA
ncbi:MAG TPA: glycerol-3-phosphate acyltransferase [Gemmatimonadaceae bacterium]|nr:glycerol-3-phosphate acyltransferase [Gemmatimonadaceae bacterium]